MGTYSYDEVLEESKKYFDGDEFAAKVFVDKYALQKKNGEYVEKSPEDMHHRLAKEFARIEKKFPNPLSEKEIFNLLKDFKYLVPQGSPMSAIGNSYQTQSISNCFVIQGVNSDKLDSYGGIMLADQELAQIMKRRGGVGLDISGIRPKNMATNNAAKTTDGIGIFMERFSNTCREVAQNGRRGALMITISCNHPEVETFITIKRDLKKVTGANISVRFTDEFMQAVKTDSEFTLRYPVDVPVEEAILTKVVKAKDIWNQLVESAWGSAEPGVLFWDTVKKHTPADIYKEEGFESISTNPCFSGDTLIATADGRNAVTIKQLAEEGKDVPVYSINPKSGKVEIKQGRNPRITGHNQSLVRVTLDDGSFLDTTPDHKFLLKSGKIVLAKDLKTGDSLPAFSKSLATIKDGGKNYYQINTQGKPTFEHRLIAKHYYPKIWEEIYNNTKTIGFAKTGGLVVHHKDYNGLNNHPDNLQVMTFKNHQQFHAEKDNAGENNGRYSGFTSEQIKEHAIILTKQLGQRFSIQDWMSYAAPLKLPVGFSQFRINQLGNILDLAKECAAELGFEYANQDPRLVKTYLDMIKQGYDARINNHKVYVSKKCEKCSNEFEIEFSTREQAFCSKKCSHESLEKNEEFKAKRLNGIHTFSENRINKVKENQAKIYSQLKFNLNRKPKMAEWEMACKRENVPYRVGRSLKFSFKNFKEVQAAGDSYNHKVVSVEALEGQHTVYNITVDDNHTVSVITVVKDDATCGQKYYNGIYVMNCGELILSKNDSCRLLLVNLSSYVDHAFQKNASFNFDLFNKHTIIAQRLMDDVIELELECIDKILLKIENDPQPEAVKLVERNLWLGIKQACQDGRRTGLGITGLGDCLAMLGITYGSDDSVRMTGEIYKALAVGANTATCLLAVERGAFPAFSYEKEKDHVFLNLVMNECSEEVRNMWKETGRRNIALTTTAPTGSVSTMTQTTSGIEPPYLLSYVRRKKHNPSDKNARVDFTDALGDKWQEFTIYHHGVKKWMDATGETDIKKSPYWGATSAEIDWNKSVELQAAAQKWICHSISKTCNLPNSATKELVSEVYMKAWESGCKGFTVYRDGSRTGVLISESDAKKKMVDGRPMDIQEMMAPKRPLMLPCEIKKAKVNGENWTLFVGLLNGKPYEIFGGLSKFVDIPNKHKFGNIIKVNDHGTTTYNLLLGDDLEEDMMIKDIANIFENKTHEAFTRIISLNLRHGTPIHYVVEQLTKDKFAEMNSFVRVVSRTLKAYIKDGIKSSSTKKCPDCGAEGTLVYIENCMTCTECKNSKCS